MDIFFEIHKDLPREGPGDSAMTAQAYHLMNQLPDNPHILDVGCGPGQQTLDLASLSSGQIDAVDMHQPFLDQLDRRASKAGLSERIHTHKMSMDALDFAEETFDIIWSEGAIYIKGFENGLRYWRKFLKPGGYIAVTEVSWIKNDPPQEVEDFWNASYPDMLAVEDNLNIITNLGYHLVDHFVLPDFCWTENYFKPLAKRIARLREKYKHNPEVQAMLDSEEWEMEIFNKYSRWYGYVFYIMQTCIDEIH